MLFRSLPRTRISAFPQLGLRLPRTRISAFPQLGLLPRMGHSPKSSRVPQLLPLYVPRCCTTHIDLRRPPTYMSPADAQDFRCTLLLPRSDTNPAAVVRAAVAAIDQPSRCFRLLLEDCNMTNSASSSQLTDDIVPYCDRLHRFTSMFSSSSFRSIIHSLRITYLMIPLVRINLRHSVDHLRTKQSHEHDTEIC